MDDVRRFEPGEVQYERTDFPFDKLTRHYSRRGLRRWFPRRAWWPPGIEAVRRVLPDHLVDAPPPALARGGSWAVVARVDGSAIGYAWAHPSIDHECYIEEAAVLPERQGRGIGTRLVQELAKWMRERGFEVLTVTLLCSDGWLTRIGFTADENVRGMYGARIADLNLDG